MEDAILEDWLERRGGGAAAAAAAGGGGGAARGAALTAREIAESWSILRECLQKHKGGVLEDGDRDIMLIALNRLSACRRSLHVALPQAKLLLSLLCATSIPREARSVAAVIFTLWLRKSPTALKSEFLSISIEAAIEIACKKSCEEELLVCERILLLGCLSAAPNVNVSFRSRDICLEVIAEILSAPQHKEGIVTSNSERIAEALAGVGYALLSSFDAHAHAHAHSHSHSHAPLFQPILHSLLSLWSLHNSFHACMTHGLMLLHLMEWLGLNLIRSKNNQISINVVALELQMISGFGQPALDFAAVMAAGGFLRALRTSTNTDLAKGSVVVQQTIIAIAGTVASNFGEVAKWPENFVFEPLSAQFPGDNEASKRRLTLQCTAVAVSYSGGVYPHANVLLCLVASLLTETFPLAVIYSSKMMDMDEHIDSVLFKEGGSITRVMCEQYRWASEDLKKLVEHLMWEFSHTLHLNHRLFTCMHHTNHNHMLKALEQITEAAFFLIVMFFSIATKEEALKEQLSVTALDALSYVEYFRVQHMQMQLPVYTDMIKCTVSCISKSASATAALVHRLPSYDDLTQFPGPSNLLSFEYHWYKDEVQTARIFFYLRILPACMERIPVSIFRLEVTPLMFLYMRHPEKSVAQGSHSVFVAFISANNLGLDSSHVDEDNGISFKEQLVVYYVQTALEAYPCLTPFKALSSAVVALLRHLSAGSPAVLYCINSLVEKLSSLYKSDFMSRVGQGTEVEGESEAIKNLRVLLLNLILLVDIQVLPDLLKLLAQLICELPEYAQNIALGDAHDLVACSDDVTRKPILVPWLQSLSFICYGLNSGGNKTKNKSERSNPIRENNLQLKNDTDKSGGLSFNPTCQKHLEHLSRL